MSVETNAEDTKDSQAKEQTPKKSQDVKKTDSYTPDKNSVGTIQAGLADEEKKSEKDSYKSDTESIGKIQETDKTKGGKKDEQRAREES